MVLGLIIVIVGLILLMQNLGLVGPEIWNVIWPCLIILVGVGLLSRRQYKQAKWERFEEKMEKAGKKFEERFKEKGK